MAAAAEAVDGGRSRASAAAAEDAADDGRSRASAAEAADGGRSRSSNTRRLRKKEKTFIIKTMLRGGYDTAKRAAKREVMDRLLQVLQTTYHRTWSVKKIQTMWSDFKSKTPRAVAKIKSDLELDGSQRRRRSRRASAPPSSRQGLDPAAVPSPEDNDEEAGPSTSHRSRSRQRRGQRRARGRSLSVASSISVRLRRRRRGRRQKSSSRPESGQSGTTVSSSHFEILAGQVSTLQQEVVVLTSTVQQLEQWKSEQQTTLQQQQADFEERLRQQEAAFRHQLLQQRQEMEGQIEEQRQRILAFREEAGQLHDYFGQLAECPPTIYIYNRVSASTFKQEEEVAPCPQGWYKQEEGAGPSKKKK
ncbi:protein SON-like [Hyperolius riggenbachi]|uniref:protein SON-like n=1 Tax=Hyperolius riggenbachi TaxID=752182 RepID=UPI0035A26F8B